MSSNLQAIFAEYSQRGFPPLITVEQAATIAAVPVKTIYEWSSKDLLNQCKCPRRGRHLRLYRNRFIEFLIGNPPDPQ